VKRIYIHHETATTDLAQGAVIHDEYANTTFVVERADVYEHSIMVYGKRLHVVPITGAAALVEYSSLYLMGENGLWDLNSD